MYKEIKCKILAIMKGKLHVERRAISAATPSVWTEPSDACLVTMETGTLHRDSMQTAAIRHH